LASVVSGAPSKGLPVDADVLPLVDSERSGGLAGLSLANLKAAISAAFVTLSGKQVVADKTFVAPRVSGSASSPASITVDGSDPNIGLELQGKGTGVLTYMGHPVLTEAVVHSAGSKVPVDLDEFLLLDSAAGFLPKKLSWANLKAAILAWFGPVTATLSNKTLTAPKIGAIADVNGVTVADFLTRANAENNIQLRASEKGQSPVMIATGKTDADVGFQFAPRGAGAIEVWAPPGQASIKFEAMGGAGNVSLNLISKGSSAVEANGQPVVTTTNTVSMSNKTLVSPTLTSPMLNGAVRINGAVPLAVVPVPSTATSPGDPGMVGLSATHLFLCVAPNTWVRAPFATW